MSIHKFSWKLNDNPKNLPRAAVIRYGAFGDTVQAASVCRALKVAGYHVTLFCSYPSSEIIAKDPHIDELVVQFQDQIPIQWLGHFWIWTVNKWKGKGFKKWVNLTESCEVNLLAMAGNLRFQWPPAARHQMMNRNYLEFQHNLAGVPYDPWFQFYPTDDERKWRNEERERMRKRGIEKFILWALAGSSRTHKLYPYADDVWKHVFKYYPQWGVVPVGDGSCVDLEAGFEGVQRFYGTCGKWNMRQVAAMIEIADVIVGPETGTMSLAAFYPMPKIVFLSHSTVENLTRDWKNTTSLWAPSTECPGRGKNEAPACHLLLPSFEGCRRHATQGTAQCAAEIKPEWVWEVLQAAMNTGEAPKWTPPLIE